MAKLPMSERFSLVKGDGRIYQIQLIDDTTKQPFDLTGYLIKYVVKEYDKINVPDDQSLAYGEAYVVDAENGLVEITLTPEETINFPLTTNAKPLVFSIQVSNPNTKFSSEFNYGLIVEQNVFTSLY